MTQNALMNWGPYVAAESADAEGSPFSKRASAQPVFADWITRLGVPQVHVDRSKYADDLRNTQAVNAMWENTPGSPWNLRENHPWRAAVADALNSDAAQKLLLASNFLIPAAFIGPAGALRLQTAGRIAPGAPGSKEALQVAQDIWRKHGMGSPELQDRVWKATGWGHPETFGGVAPGSKPMTWVDTSKTTLKPEIWQALDPAFAGGKFEARTGRLGDLVELPADLQTAQPALASKTSRVEANNGGHGQVSSRNDGTMSEYVLPGGGESITFGGNSKPDLVSTLKHELAHLASIEDGVGLRGARVGEPPVRDTTAEKIGVALRRIKPSEAGEARDLAAYLNNTQERLARASVLYDNMAATRGPSAIWDTAPHRLDVYAPEAMTPAARDYFDAKGRVSRDYQPPAELVRRDGAAGVTPPGQTFSHPPQGIRANGKPKVASPADRFNAGRDVDMNTIEEILRRYGLAGLMAGGAAASARSSQDTQ